MKNDNLFYINKLVILTLMVESKVVELRIACEQCGSKMKVKVVKQTGLNAPEMFNCLKCNKEHFITASLAIKKEDIVLLIGKED